jgi:hypothetical protein
VAPVEGVDAHNLHGATTASNRISPQNTLAMAPMAWPSRSCATSASAGTIPSSPFDDASRLVYTELLADERKHSATAFVA